MYEFDHETSLAFDDLQNAYKGVALLAELSTEVQADHVGSILIQLNYRLEELLSRAKAQDSLISIAGESLRRQESGEATEQEKALVDALKKLVVSAAESRLSLSN